MCAHLPRSRGVAGPDTSPRSPPSFSTNARRRPSDPILCGYPTNVVCHAHIDLRARPWPLPGPGGGFLDMNFNAPPCSRKGKSCVIFRHRRGRTRPCVRLLPVPVIETAAPRCRAGSRPPVKPDILIHLECGWMVCRRAQPDRGNSCPGSLLEKGAGHAFLASFSARHKPTGPAPTISTPVRRSSHFGARSPLPFCRGRELG